MTRLGCLLAAATLLAAAPTAAVAAPAERDEDVVLLCAPGQEELEVDAAGQAVLDDACAAYDKAFTAAVDAHAKKVAALKAERAEAQKACREAPRGPAKKAKCKAAGKVAKRVARALSKAADRRDDALDDAAEDFYDALDAAGLFGEDEEIDDELLEDDEIDLEED